MRDLASRLRSIVRQNQRPASPAPLRELTYEPSTGWSFDPARVADALGGTLHEAGRSSCVAVDRRWDFTHWHGRRRLATYVPDPAAPLALFDSRAAAADTWASRMVFFDVETTGLSGGAGTLAFLVGCGWFEDEGFRVRQLFLSGPAGEHALLDALSRIFSDATLLVTFNGRTFDVPLMETRWAFHRTSSPTDDLPHFDMLPPARRLWGRRDLHGANRVVVREAAGWETSPRDEGHNRSCSLSALERSVLGFHRMNDVPGFEIPARYFHFLRTGETQALEGILEHNRHDLVSLAAVMSHALSLAHDGPEACQDAGEQVALGRLYERAGEMSRAARAYELASGTGEREIRSLALARLAVLLKREERYDESAAAWLNVLELSNTGPSALTTLERRAAEALAIHHEHRARNLSAAKRYAEALKGRAIGRSRQEVEHRLGRLERKMRIAQNTKGGPETAPLFNKA